MNFADHEELAARQARRQRKRRNEILWNTLTALMLVATVVMIGVMLLLFSNPHLSINPFPPPTLPARLVLATSTPTLVMMPPTWTPTPKTAETPRPTVTATIPEPTAFKITTAPTNPVTTIDPSIYPYAIDGQPNAMANTVFRTDETCDWQGVAGKLVDLQGRPVVGVLVHLTGLYNGKTIDMTTITGGASAWYGESGYEFLLGTTPTNSTGTLAVQLNDQSLSPVSNRVIINTYSTCDKNLTLVNFKQVR